MDKTLRVLALQRIPILAGLSQSKLEGLDRDCTWRTYEPGQQILSFHDSSSDVLFLVSGKVRVVIYSSDGKAVLFTELRSGAMFGELAAFDRGPRSAAIEAIEAATVVSLTASHFESLLVREPSVALATIRHIIAEVRRLTNRVVEFSTLAVQSRIHAELLRLAADAGFHTGQALLSPAPSLSDIANRISTHREAVSRELSRLGSIGLLRREGGNLHIADIGLLKKLVSEAKGE